MHASASSSLPSPDLLGLPFSRWRDRQAQTILAALDSKRRFIAIQAPTGVGKSLIAYGIASFSGTGAILTATKALQDQYDKTSEAAVDPLSLDIRGAGNYQCLAARDQFRMHFPGRRLVGCDEGPCRVGSKCELKTNGCLFFDQVRAAQTGQMLVTSYAFWLAYHRFGEGLGKRDLLILDEAHDADTQLSEHLTIELSAYDVGRFPEAKTHAAWRRWAGELQEPIARKILSAGAIRDRLRYKQLGESVGQLVNLPDDWVWEAQAGTMRFAPVLVQEYAEAALFRGASKVVLMSATITEKTLKALGIKKAEWITLPSPFEIKRRPVRVYVDRVFPLRVDNRMTPEIAGEWLHQIDAFVGKRSDRKGLMPSVSYARQTYLLQHSRHRARMIAPANARELPQAIQRFRALPASSGAILVSPALTEGFDFAYDAAEYIVIVKIPFPDMRSPLAKARLKRDKDYRDALTARTLVQTIGRAMRAADDRCETIIFDDHARWFLKYKKAFFPKWFLEAVRFIDVQPTPLPKLHVT